MSCPLKVILNKHKKAISKMEVKKKSDMANDVWRKKVTCGNQYI